MTKKATRNSFKLTFTLFQLTKRHKGINKVVNKTKKSEIPSIPNTKFKFKVGTHKNLLTNWNVPMDLLKKIHRTSERIKVKHDTFRATKRNKTRLDDGIINKKNTPIKGNINMHTNKFLILNIIF
jgi:hypothetical protein